MDNHAINTEKVLAAFFSDLDHKLKSEIAEGAQFSIANDGQVIRMRPVALEMMATVLVWAQSTFAMSNEEALEFALSFGAKITNGTHVEHLSAANVLRSAIVWNVRTRIWAADEIEVLRAQSILLLVSKIVPAA